MSKEYFYLRLHTDPFVKMRWQYKYPQRAFPYAALVEEIGVAAVRRQFELIDTGVFENDRYFDVFASTPRAVGRSCHSYHSAQCGPEAARLQVLPTVWFRNTWSWKETVDKPVLHQASSRAGASVVALDEPRYGRRYLCCDGLPNVLVTENETNTRRLFGSDAPRAVQGRHQRRGRQRTG